MTQNDFDPSKLDIDFSKIDEIGKEKKEEIKEISSQNNDILSNINTSSPQKTETSSLQPKVWEEKKEIDIETLSTILTDADVRTDALKKLDEEKIASLQDNSSQNSQENSIIFDINIRDINDLIEILLKNQYDFFAMEPSSDFVKISFKKDSILKEVKYVKFPTYLQLLLKAKKISKLNIEDTTSEQKWSGVYPFKDKNLDVLSKTTPGSFGEILFFKAKLSEQKVAKKAPVKKSISAGTAFWFLWAILFIALVLGWAFLTFVVLNAQTPEDVSFFANLWINLNDINSFLLKITTFVFSVVIVLLTIVLIIFLFKALVTKKEFKKKRIALFIVSGFLLTVTFSTASLWMYLDKAIKWLPNWQEMSYGKIQMFDNNLLNDENIGKAGAIIQDASSLIWPIDIKFDVSYLQRDEQRQWFQIQKYIWDFGNRQIIETQIPEVMYTFDTKWTHQVSLTLEGIDIRFPDRVTTKPASESPQITLSYVVDISDRILPNGGKTVSFDASDLRPLWEIEWYLKEDLSKPAYVWYMFQPAKIYFEPDLIGMRIKNSPSKFMDRIFTIRAETSEISWEIAYDVSYNNDLEYTFRVENIENNFWDGFIESFTWSIDGRETKKTADILNIEESSTFKYTFREYGNYEVKVTLTNSSGKSTQISAMVNTAKKIKLTNNIEFFMNNAKIQNIKYDPKTLEYFIYDIGAPTRIDFDAKLVRADNPLYVLEEIKWDAGSDENYEGEWRQFSHDFNFEGFEDVTVKYKFVHRRDKTDIIEFEEKIHLEFVQKEAVVNLQMKSESEYAPTIVRFDASLSRVQNDNIVKFIYDYGNGIVEERDAINPWHRYLKAGNYTVTLTIVTQKGKEYSTSKSLVLKPFEAIAKIKTSLKRAPIGQEINFLSTDSLGQIVAYHWDFWDGNFSRDANPSYAYKKSGTYKVKLTIDLANNNVMTDEIEIEIF